jgi:UPF0755 protein
MTSPSDEHVQRLQGNQRPGRPGRRRRRWLFGVLLVGLMLGCAAAAWLSSGRLSAVGLTELPLGSRLLAWTIEQQAAQLAAPSTDATPVAFEIGPGETLAQLAARLEAQRLIRSAAAFRLLARVRGVDRQIQAGDHVLRADMTAQEVLDELMIGTADSVTVTIPEGLRAEEVATLLAQRGVAGQAEFLAAVAGGSPRRAALAERPAGAGLEGYLFPDTYQFRLRAGAEPALETFLDTFEARVLPLVQGVGTGAPADLTLHEVITLASIVEREAALPEERGMIARVFLNRLAAPPFLLNADPTVQYAVGFQPEAGTWWKRPLLATDLQVDSPYNTYVTPGLPPGPIANPGRAAIEAVLRPADGPWQFFVANEQACDGSHVFAETFDQHLQNIATYQTGGCVP